MSIYKRYEALHIRRSSTQDIKKDINIQGDKDTQKDKHTRRQRRTWIKEHRL